MKKILLTFAIILTMVFSVSAQDGFFRSDNSGERTDTPIPGVDEPLVPHGSFGIGDQDAAPLGSGLLVLTALGAGYALSRKREK
ncbi:MAG: hypothetical protein II817_05050 [Bacteroidales bacterium]|nr:hypothetical protein [Bacteroidales bacterium]